MPRRKSPLAAAASDLNSAAIHLLRGLRVTDRAAGLTPARLSALSVIVFGGPCPLGRLARAEGVAGPTMTRIVDGLCELGLAERRPHPDGGRSVIIAPTPEGARVMHTAAQARIDTIVAALRTLPAADRATIVAAGPVLRTLADRVADTARTADRPRP